MRFIESILYQDGDYYNLNLHQERMNAVFAQYAPGDDAHDRHGILPDLKMEGTYKVRLVYDMDSEDAAYDLEFAEYQPRKIKALEVVRSRPFDYAMKYEDRNEINKLVARSSSDDIIIAINDQITDGSYFNLAFWDGSQWLTPDTPLLKGVRRAQLLQEKKIKEAPIYISDIHAFEKVSLINSMMDLEELELSISAIFLPKNDD